MKKSFIQLIFLAFFVSASLGVPVTAAEPAANPEVTETQTLTVSTEAEKALRDRVTARWDALIGNDLEKAYSFETPAYREKRTFDQYKTEFGGFIMWHKMAIERVDFAAADAAKVRVAINATMFPPSGGPDIETVTYLDEQWSQIDGQWWYATN